MAIDVEPNGLSYWTRGVTSPTTPVGKSKLSDLMNYDPRHSYKHKQLWEFHLNWSHSDYGHTSLASVREIRKQLLLRSPSGKALSLQHINRGNRDLCDWGYLIELERGRGKRGSRFAINWDLLDIAAAGNFPPSVTHGGDATTTSPPPNQGGVTAFSVTHVGDTCVTQEVNTKTGSVTHRGDEDLTTGTGLIDPVTGVDSIDLAVAAPPPAPPPLCGAGGMVPANDFEELWSAYAYRHQKAEAKAAWAKVKAYPDLAATIIAAARDWKAAWDEGGGAKTGRKTLAKWLHREDYDCEPTRRQRPATGGRGTPGNDNAPTAAQKPTTMAPQAPVRHAVTIKSADLRDGDTGDFIHVLMEDGAGNGFEKRLRLYDDCDHEKHKARRQLASLCRAANLNSIEDTEELHGREIEIIKQPSGEIDFAPILMASADG
ncbi:hypothetical protein [Aurantimonas coralicida]|uniref:hypothetical protein n=1 Tax=Aurantimonas coralicida TaxID=182270 RepID=UPI001E60ED27|nr:hypothetical protein [Aurantimonas coralicida]MCD1642460.1 hypothetical protein [Aurantimonas coralicida]